MPNGGARKVVRPFDAHGFSFPPGTEIVPAIHLAHHSEAAFPHAEVFDPSGLPTGGRRLHARGMTLQGAELLEWTVDNVAGSTTDVSFVFPDARLTVFNALDENGLTFAPPGPNQRVRPCP